MATNLAISSDLIEEARNIGGHKTKKAAVIVALKEYIRRKKQLNILNLFKKIEYDQGYDYKKQRKVK